MAKKSTNTPAKVGARTRAPRPSGVKILNSKVDSTGQAEEVGASTTNFEAEAVQNLTPHQRGGIISVVIGTVVAVILIAGSVVATWPYWASRLATLVPASQQDIAEAEWLSALEGRIGKAEASLVDTVAKVAENQKDVEAELKALQAHQQILSEEIASTLVRLAHLGQALTVLRETSISGGIVEVNAELGAMGTRIAALELVGAPRDQLSQPLDGLVARMAVEEMRDAAIANLAMRNQELADAVGALTGRMSEVDAARSSTGDGADANLLVAIADLRRLLVGSRSFEDAFSTVVRAADGDAELKALVEPLRLHAAKGVSTRDQLRSRFAAVAQSMVNADATSSGNGWFGQAANTLRGLITIRRVGGGPSHTDVDSAVSRAETALISGELAVAVTSLGSLSGPAADVAEDWLSDARGRLVAEQVLATLDGRAALALAGTGGGN